MSDTHLTLIENAIDFIEDATRQIAKSNPTSKDIKYAILHLSSGIELLLKQLLFEKHWSYIFKDPDQASESALESGNFYSVNLKNALKRLIDIGYKLEDEEIEPIHQLRGFRNIAEHYSVKFEKVQIIQLISNCCEVVMNIVNRYDLRKRHKNIINELELIHFNLSKFENFVNDRYKSIKPKIQKLMKDSFIFLNCPTCLQKAMPLTNSETQCEFCNTKYSRDELKVKWVNSFSYKNLGVEPSQRNLDIFEKVLTDEERINTSFHKCLICRHQDFTFDFNQNIWICFECATTWLENEFSVCDSCGYIDHSQNMQGGMCNQCASDNYGTNF